MAQHRLEAGPDTVHWGHFNAALKPLITVNSGDRVTFTTLSGLPDQLPDPRSYETPPALPAIHAKVQHKQGPHICTGPVAVRGARAGDVLEVRIISVELHHDWGFNMIRPGAGALPDDFKQHRVCDADRADANISARIHACLGFLRSNQEYAWPHLATPRYSARIYPCWMVVASLGLLAISNDFAARRFERYWREMNAAGDVAAWPFPEHQSRSQ